MHVLNLLSVRLHIHIGRIPPISVRRGSDVQYSKVFTQNNCLNNVFALHR